jgi:hypothetical protein
MAQNNDLWAEYLANALSYMNGGQISCILKKYETLASQTTSKKAFSALLESYGNEYIEPAVSKIELELERISHKTIDANPITRLRDTIRRLQTNTEKCGVELSGIDENTLAPWQKENIQQARQSRVKIVIPEALKEKTFEALGKYGNRISKLELEVRF